MNKLLKCSNRCQVLGFYVQARIYSFRIQKQKRKGSLNKHPALICFIRPVDCRCFCFRSRGAGLVSGAYSVSSHTINICALHDSSLPSAGVKSHAHSLAAGHALSMKHVLEKAGTVPLA